MDRVNEKLIALIERALSGVDKSVDFLVGEIPDFLNQLLLWHAAKSAVVFGVGLLLMFACVAIVRKVHKAQKEANYYDTDIVFFTSLGCGVVTVVCLMLFMQLDWLQIWLAPKVWLVEYAADLAK